MFEDVEVLERALRVLGRVLWGALGALGVPWEVPERSLGMLGGPWWVLVGSLGPHTGKREKHYCF